MIIIFRKIFNIHCLLLVLATLVCCSSKVVLGAEQCLRIPINSDNPRYSQFLLEAVGNPIEAADINIISSYAKREEGGTTVLLPRNKTNSINIKFEFSTQQNRGVMNVSLAPWVASGEKD